MYRPISIALLAAAGFLLSACASKTPATHAQASQTGKTNAPTVITVARNGGVSVNHQSVPLKKLAVTLKDMGVAKPSKFTVEGEPGSDQQKIETVLETLVVNGYLPKNTID